MTPSAPATSYNLAQLYPLSDVLGGGSQVRSPARRHAAIPVPNIAIVSDGLSGRGVGAFDGAGSAMVENGLNLAMSMHPLFRRLPNEI